jgi:BirA family biotin operon repressor/biotin-[acetyl-CoA-carboxylase] ligase
VAGERKDGGVDAARRKPDDWGRAWPDGWSVEHVAETGSTNADVLASADRRGDRNVLVADHQFAGRGRLDRRWEAPRGENLLASLLFRDVPDDAGGLVRRVSLAAVDAIGAVASSAGRPSLKWPNDVLLDGIKVAGVLAQRSGSGAVVVGIGINVGWCPVGGARLGSDVSRPDLLAAMLVAFDRLPVGADDLMARYRQELATLGRRVRLEMPDGDIVGVALDVTALGQLIVRVDSGVTRSVDVADVTHLRLASDRD